MEQVTSFLVTLAGLASCVWAATEGIGRVFNVTKERAALVLGPMTGVVAHGLGFLGIQEKGAWGWIGGVFFGLLATFAAGAGHDYLVKPALPKQAMALLLGALLLVGGALPAQAAGVEDFTITGAILGGGDIKYAAQIGLTYEIAKSGWSVGPVLEVAERDAVKGTATGLVDYDDFTRWPPVMVTLPFEIPDKTEKRAGVLFSYKHRPKTP